jgi:predicted metalloprotease with PDZ domain
MEHRNSTSISMPGVSLGTLQGRRQALGAVAHEFFHTWNVERIRPVGLEPFDFTRENITCCLWLAEGFTDYYGSLTLVRAGFSQQPPVSPVESVVNGSGRLLRSAVQMSEQAPFADAAVANDPDDRPRTFISYYSYGAALALALDLSLRDRTAGARSLDDFMRRLWLDFGKPAGVPIGYVARPYTVDDLRAALAAVSGDPEFAGDFFRRFIEGRESADYAGLLLRAGLVLRPASPERGWIGRVPMLAADGGLKVGEVVPFNTPLYSAGVDSGDVIVSIDGQAATLAAWNGIAERRPGTRVALGIRRRDGSTLQRLVDVAADPALEVVALERAGTALTDAQRQFRAAWLRSRN